ncbi:UvrD-helicase domain-containing protein [Streptomyces sp. NPDC058385]|uniref:UvrD-helicase domain-containing protein n=1 Tax=Streptomyces sp. NPDC058385 TaxID=3346473 RepID=UPI00364A0F33
MQATQEQQAARDVFAAGTDLALIAGAGTGKTSTLVLMGGSTRKRGLYLAFNRGIADEARRRFAPNVQCRTAHSLAYQACGHLYRERLGTGARIPARQTARLLGLRDMVLNRVKVTASHQARLVMGMVRRYCYTSDRDVMARHMERVNGLDWQAQEHLAQVLLPYARQAWEDVRSPRGRLRFEHDHYLKMWALTQPTLGADFILLDEAQDTNAVVEEVFLAQDAQRVCVGDPAQQIYAWRHARDVMSGFPAEHRHLTQSFRFGPRIAAMANRWLRHAESEMQLTGHGPDSLIGRATEVDAVLCRGNADAMQEVLGFLEQGVRVGLAGGGEALRRVATAALELKAGRRTSHPELFLFSSWGEVQEYAEQDSAAQDLKAIVQLVDAYGPQTIIQAVDRLSAEQEAQVVVSTAHKAKGREWGRVRIGQGFTAPLQDGDGIQQPLRADEARLVYVAVTRARQVLDPSGIAWIDAFEQRARHTGPGLAQGRPMIDLPLTGQLRYPDSPISQFMAAHLPRARRLVQDYLIRTTGLPHPVQPLDVRRPQWPALGHAIDYRLRLRLGRPLGDAVALGVRRTGMGAPLNGAGDPAVQQALLVAGTRLLKLVDAFLVHRDILGEEELGRLCFVAGFYEDIYRTGQIRRTSLLAHATGELSLEGLLAAVPSYAVADQTDQMALAQAPFAPFVSLPDSLRLCGPVFSGSGDIGGADADFILDHTLIDCKSTTQPRRLGVEEIYQLAGYLLLDYDDHHGIDRVGLYLSRQGHLITWSTEEFLSGLGAQGSLAQLRTALHRHLADARIQARTHGAPAAG